MKCFFRKITAADPTESAASLGQRISGFCTDGNRWEGMGLRLQGPERTKRPRYCSVNAALPFRRSERMEREVIGRKGRNVRGVDVPGGPIERRKEEKMSLHSLGGDSMASVWRKKGCAGKTLIEGEMRLEGVLQSIGLQTGLRGDIRQFRVQLNEACRADAVGKMTAIAFDKCCRDFDPCFIVEFESAAIAADRHQ